MKQTKSAFGRAPLTIGRIRRELRRRKDSLFFTDAERALLAVLESEPFESQRQAIINADYTRGRSNAERAMRETIERSWNA